MRELIKKYSGLIFAAAITLAMIAILGGADEMGQIHAALGELDKRWVWAAGGCIALYLFLRMAALRFYLGRRGFTISWTDAASVTGAGQFYSAITPSASGGQPMQVLYLHRRNVPVSIGTACICVKFIGFQLGFLALGAVMGFVYREMLSAQLAGLRWLVGLGFAVNSGLIVAVLLTLPKSKWVDGLIRWLVRLGEKIRLIKDGDEAQAGFLNMLEEYRNALFQLLRSPLDAFVMGVLSLLQVISFMAVSVCLYRAFGLSGVNAGQIFALQLMLFIAAAFVPLPGAAGAQEGGFCVFFRGVFPESNLIAAMVCWRFFSYYLLMFMGLAMMLPAWLRSRSDRRKGKNLEEN